MLRHLKSPIDVGTAIPWTYRLHNGVSEPHVPQLPCPQVARLESVRSRILMDCGHRYLGYSYRGEMNWDTRIFFSTPPENRTPPVGFGVQLACPERGAQINDNFPIETLS